jgi:hypothetical protein
MTSRADTFANPHGFEPEKLGFDRVRLLGPAQTFVRYAAKTLIDWELSHLYEITYRSSSVTLLSPATFAKPQELCVRIFMSKHWGLCLQFQVNRNTVLWAQHQGVNGNIDQVTTWLEERE